MRFHTETPITRGFADYSISPMYGILPEHEAAIILLALPPILFWLAARRAASHESWSRSLADGYTRLSGAHRLAAWLLAESAAVHLGLALGHEPGSWTVAYAIGAALLTGAFIRLILHGATRSVRVITLASIVAFVTSGLAGNVPDQVGLVTKLAEVTTLLALSGHLPRSRLRSVMHHVGIVGLVLLVGLGAWVGAFEAGSGGHHAGETPAPGVALPEVEERLPTDHEVAEAQEFYEATLAALAKYEDLDVAAADGYRVDGLYGTDFHADNPAHLADDRIFDPARPETLVYADSPSGAVLLGAMFQMSEIGKAGPAVGGPLTVWHAHNHVCLSVLPLGLAGLSDPFGLCPAGTVTIPFTNEMIHVWVLPGLDEPFGDIDDEWLAAYLEPAD